MRQAKGLIVLLLGAGLQHAGPAMAQTAGAPIAGRFEIAAGAAWTGTAPVGARDATLTAADGSRFRLFSTSSELTSAAGAELRIGARVAAAVDVEVTASYSVPRLTTRVTADSENSAATTASEPIGQLMIEGAAVIYLPRRLGSRLVPFATAGGGYLQQLDERQTLLQRGRVVHLGGGVKLPLMSRAAGQRRLKQIGVRVDVRALVRPAAVTLDDRAHIAPTVAASLYVRF
ncbi:MAG: hypothetical protein ABI868_05535 [Acidobacteriota bacterium]